MLGNERALNPVSDIHGETQAQPRVKEIVYHGIPITVTIDERSSSTTISLQGPHKRWNFTIMQLSELVASGHVENTPGTQATVRGETTALAAVGMNQIQAYADRTQQTLWYKFDTEHPAMITWYNNGGKAVLGVNKGFETDIRIIRRREFSPIT